MPAFASKSEGSSGTSEELGKSLQPRSSKNFKKAERISAVVIMGTSAAMWVLLDTLVKRINVTTIAEYGKR